MVKGWYEALYHVEQSHISSDKNKNKVNLVTQWSNKKKGHLSEFKSYGKMFFS